MSNPWHIPSGSPETQRKLWMAVLGIAIERTLDEVAPKEKSMRFQGLVVVLGTMCWPGLVTRQGKKDCLSESALAYVSHTTVRRRMLVAYRF